jgi:hypothetical protein
VAKNKLLLSLTKRLDDYELEVLISWIVYGLRDIGLEHNEMCAITRPHSHSADCDCGADEIQDKVLKILDVSNG